MKLSVGAYFENKHNFKRSTITNIIGKTIVFREHKHGFFSWEQSIEGFINDHPLSDYTYVSILENKIKKILEAL